MTLQAATILPRLLPRIRNVIGVDIGMSCVKVVRLRSDRNGALTLLAADILPQEVVMPTAPATAKTKLQLPKALQAWSAGVAYSFPQAVVKLLTLPADKVEQSSYADLLGLTRTSEHRIAHLAIKSEGKNDVPVIVVGVATAEIEWIQSLMPPGKPVLGSVEVSGLSVLAAYQRICVDEATPRCDLVIDAGERITTMAIFFKDRPLVIRPFLLGAAAVVEQVMQDLSVDAATARDILNVGSIDVRSSVHRVYEEFLRQLGIAVDFAERRSGRRIEKILLSGGFAGNQDFVRELHGQVGLTSEIWNPWENMVIQPDAVSSRAKGHENSFHAATGVALGLLEIK